MDANGGNHAPENGGNHALAAGNGGIPTDQAEAQNGAAGNGGIPAHQAVAQNRAAGNGGIPAHQDVAQNEAAGSGWIHAHQAVAQNGAGGNGGIPAHQVVAQNGAAGNGGIPAHQAVAQNGAAGNGGIPAHQAVAQNGAAGNGGIPDDHAEGNGRTPASALRDRSVDSLYHTLLRLSAREIAQGRDACKLWRDLTSKASFRLDHHRHRCRTPMPLFFYRLDHQIAPVDPPEDPNTIRIDLRAVDIPARRSPAVFRFTHVDPALPIVDPRVFRIEGSCDGILLMSYNTRLYACNPCTHHWARLPPFHVNRDIIGFYAFDGVNQREYRVLYHDGYHDNDCRYWIFNLTFPELGERYIGRPTTTEAIELLLAGGIVPSYEMPPVVIADSLHWRPQVVQANSNVVVFDTVSEVFRWIPPPRVLEGDHLVQVEGDQLLEIDGRLAMILVAQTRVDIWVLILQDQIGAVWDHEYHMDLPVDLIQDNHGYEEDEDGVPFLSAAVFVVSHNRNELVQCPHIMFQCDVMGTLLRAYHCAHHLTVLSRFVLQESLLHHEFLPLRASDGNDEDPPFYQFPDCAIVVNPQLVAR